MAANDLKVQYLTGKELTTIIVDLGDFALLTADSFNESLILEKNKING